MTRGPARVGAIVLALGTTLALVACATPQDVRTAAKDQTDRTDVVRADLEGKQAELRRELKETRELAAELQSRLRGVQDQDLSGVQGRLEKQEKDIRDVQRGLENQSVQMAGLVGAVDQKLLRKFDDQTGRVKDLQGQLKAVETEGQGTSARLAEVEKNLARVGDTMKEVAAKLSAQAQQHSASLGKLEETSKRMDQEVRVLVAQVNQFQGTLTEFSKVLHAMADKSTQVDRRVAEVSGNTEGKVGLLIVQQGEQAVKMEQLAKRVEVEGQAVTMHLNEVTRNVTALSKALDATVATVNDTARSVSDLSRAMEVSVGKLAARADEHGEALNQLAQRVEGGATVVSGPAPIAKPLPAPAVSDRDAYDRAYQEYIQGRYDSAIGSLGEFLTRYPESPLVPNAHFWIAESYFRTHDYARGIELYDHVIARYPKSGKAPTALYKKALALLELKDKAAAKTTLRQLIADYPKSDDSARAQAKLSSLR